MGKIWLIAQHHVMQEVRKRSFVLVLLALPLFLTVTIGAGYLAARLDKTDTALGYVDPADLVGAFKSGQSETNVRLVGYDSEEMARRALDSGEIGAYYLLPANAGGRAQLIYHEAPAYESRRHLENLVRRNLMTDQTPALVERVVSGANVTVHATERNRVFPGGDPSAGLFVPIIGAAIFSFLVLTTFGYMAEALAVEKENRTMEIVITSVSPGRLMAGKISGAVGIAAMQLAVWVACLVLALHLGSTVFKITWLSDIDPSWRDLAVIVIVALPSYVFLTALTSAIGATLVETQEAHQMGGFAFMILFLPLYLLVPILRSPNGPLALALSFFPLTSVTTIAIRSLLIEVPTWQVAVAAGAALVCGFLAVWLAGKAFRASMLRYGQRLAWRSLFTGRAPAESAGAGPVEAMRRA